MMGTTAATVAWPIAGLRKDARTPSVAAAIADARALTRRTGCPDCGTRAGAFDYEYIKTPYALRYFVLCPNGHLDQF